MKTDTLLFLYFINCEILAIVSLLNIVFGYSLSDYGVGGIAALCVIAYITPLYIMDKIPEE
jgi:hypothetical protein